MLTKFKTFGVWARAVTFDGVSTIAQLNRKLANSCFSCVAKNSNSGGCMLLQLLLTQGKTALTGNQLDALFTHNVGRHDKLLSSSLDTRRALSKCSL